MSVAVKERILFLRGGMVNRAGDRRGDGADVARGEPRPGAAGDSGPIVVGEKTVR